MPVWKKISTPLTKPHATMKTLHKSLVVNQQAHRSVRFMGSQAGLKKCTSLARSRSLLETMH
jgi:hypothetical protein